MQKRSIMKALILVDLVIWVRVVATLGVFMLMKLKALAAMLTVVVVESDVWGRRWKKIEG